MVNKFSINCSPIYVTKKQIILFIFFFVSVLVVLTMSLSMIIQGCFFCLDGPVVYDTLTSNGKYDAIEYIYDADKSYQGLTIFEKNDYKCYEMSKFYTQDRDDAMSVSEIEFPIGSVKKFYHNKWSNRCFDSVMLLKYNMYYQLYLSLGIMILMFMLIPIIFSCCFICRCSVITNRTTYAVNVNLHAEQPSVSDVILFVNKNKNKNDGQQNVDECVVLYENIYKNDSKLILFDDYVDDKIINASEDIYKINSDASLCDEIV